MNEPIILKFEAQVRSSELVAHDQSSIGRSDRCGDLDGR
nr:MAG TPA: hypothetical protein [Caudoviricetes sp.]